MYETIFAVLLMITGTTHSLEGTLMAIDGAKPPHLTINAHRQFQTFETAASVIVERESRLAGTTQATTARIDLADLTPGEFVRVQIDSRKRVTRALAIARLERVKVRAVNGSAVVLQDGTTLTIGSVLRFVNDKGKASSTVSVKAGETVTLYRHPETQNIYRIAADRRAMPRKLKKQTNASK